MPTLNLPLEDGCLFVDNSMMELLTTCPRALQYNRFHRRIAAVNKPSLSFGSAVHLALEHRYKTYANRSPDQELTNSTTALLTQFFAETPTPMEDYRNLNWALEIVGRYNDRYNIEPFNLLTDSAGKVQVELAFALPLFTYKSIPVIYTGRVDLPVMWDDQLFVIDHKTTSMLGPQFFDKMKMSAQQKGYCWAFRELTGLNPAGYCINAIRVKQPPAYLTDLTSVPRGKKQTVASWWEESLQRERYFLRDGELDEWKENCIALIEEMFWHAERSYMPMKTAWCNQFGRCQYYDVCSLPQSDRGVMLSSGLFTDNLWNPLKK